MDKMPPPAPLKAWATLSDCCAAVDGAIFAELEVKSYFISKTKSIQVMWEQKKEL